MGCSDEELMQDLQRGEMQAFDALYERHSRPLFNFIRRLLRDESLAEDVFQETCMRVLQNAGRFDPRARFRTWLYAVAHNMCMDERRRRRRRMSIPADELPGPTPEPDPHERLESGSAQRLLGGLRPELRAVVTIPSWMLLDARQRGERAAAWGLFGLLGNVMALVVYLLVRRDPEETG